MAEITLQHFVEVVQTALNPQNSKDQGNANKWLVSFQSSDAAWTICAQAIYHDNQKVAFYSANMLVSKVRTEWRSLSPAARASMQELFASLLRHLLTSEADHSIVDRFALALAAAAVSEGTAAINLHIATALDVSSSASSLHGMRVSLAMLEALGTEGITKPHRNKQAVIDSLQSHLPDVLRLLELCALGQNIDDSTAAAEPLTLQFLGSLTFTPLVETAMKAASAFISAGIRLDTLQRYRPGLLGAVLLALGSADEHSSIQEHASVLLIELIGEMGRSLEETVRAASLASEHELSALGPSAELASRLILSPEAAASIRAHRSVDLEDVGLSSSIRASASADVLDLDSVNYALIAMQSILVGIAAMYDKFRTSLVADDCGFVFTMCKVCTTIVAGVPRMIASDFSNASVILDILLEGSQHPSIKIMDVADEAWPYILAIPTSERPLLGRDFLMRLTERLIRGCTYPEDFPEFGMWEDYEPSSGDPEFYEVDEPMFNMFRESVLAAALQGLFLEMRAELVEYLAALLVHADDAGWQTVEAILFAARAISIPVKALFKHASLRNSAQRNVQEQAIASEFLSAIFRGLGAQDSLFTSSPRIIAAGARFVQSFASWVARKHDLVGPTVAFLLKALRVSAAASWAASSLRVVLNGTPHLFADWDTIASMIDAFDLAQESKSVKGDDSQITASAIARTIAHLSDAESRDNAYKKLLASVISRLTTTADAESLSQLKTLEEIIVAGGLPLGESALPRRSLADELGADSTPGRLSEAAVQAARTAFENRANAFDAITSDLCIVSACIMLAPPEDVSSLLSYIWPVLTQVSEGFRHNEAVVGSLCAVVAAVIQAGQETAWPIFQHLSPFLLSLQSVTPTAACFDAISSAVDVFANSNTVSDVERTDFFQNTLHASMQPGFEQLAADCSLLASKPLLFSAMFQAGLKYLLRLPLIIIHAPELTLLLHAASSVLSMASSETDLVRTALAFTSRVFYVVSPTLTMLQEQSIAMLSGLHIPLDRYSSVRERVDATAGALAPEFASQLLQLVADAPNPDIIDSIADTLLCVVAAYVDVCKPALHEALDALVDFSDRDVAACFSVEVRSAVISKLLDVGSRCLGVPGSDVTRPFQAFIADFLAVYRGHASPESLDRQYERAPGIVSAASLARS